MSPFSLLLLVGTCSAFLYIDDVDDGINGVDQRPSLTSLFPRSPNPFFFHNSPWNFPARPLLPPQPTFLKNRHNSGGHSAFPGFSHSPFPGLSHSPFNSNSGAHSDSLFKHFVSPHPFPPFHVVRPPFAPNLLNRNKQDLDFFNHELDHIADIISPLLNFFHSYLDSSINFVLSIEDDDSGIGSVKVNSSMEEDTSQWNVNHDDILDEIFVGDDIETMYPNVDKEFGSPNFNQTKDMEEYYEDGVIESAVIGHSRLPHNHFDDIMEEIFESPEDDSDIGTEKLNHSMEEDTRLRNVNLDDIMDEIFEGDDIEDDDVVTDTVVIENARDAIPVYNILFPCPHSLSELQEIFENDNSQMLDSIDSTVEKDKGLQNFDTTNYTKVDYDVLNEIPENDDNEMLYPNVEKHLESSNPTKEMKEGYEEEVIDCQPEIDFGDEIKNATQKQDESSNSIEEDMDHEFEPTIILFR